MTKNNKGSIGFVFIWFISFEFVCHLKFIIFSYFLLTDCFTQQVSFSQGFLQEIWHTDKQTSFYFIKRLMKRSFYIVKILITSKCDFQSHFQELFQVIKITLSLTKTKFLHQNFLQNFYDEHVICISLHHKVRVNWSIKPLLATTLLSADLFDRW